MSGGTRHKLRKLARSTTDVLGFDWGQLAAAFGFPVSNPNLSDPFELASHDSLAHAAFAHPTTQPMLASMLARRGGTPTTESLMDRARRAASVLGETRTFPSAGANYTDRNTVMAVQDTLNHKGYGPLKVDGIMGPKTSGAIEKMQSAHGIPQTGVIDEGVIEALNVTPGVLPPGVSASAKAAVEAQAAVDAAKAADAAAAAETAATPADVQAAAAKVVAAVPDNKPDLKKAAQVAQVAATIATTPAQVEAAKQQVQTVAQQVKSATSVTPWWQWAIIGVGGLAVVGGVLSLVLGRRRKR
jgi:peptidoglycan hydrolase-like protein with peptidoglycan-binding domain